MSTLLEVKELGDKMHREWESYRKENDARLDEVKKNGASTAYVEEKLTKINAALDAAEKKFAAALADFEAKAKTPPNPKAEIEKKREEYHTAYNGYLRKGDRAPEVKALIASNDETGGYLIPEEVQAGLIKTITEMNPIRRVARVVPCGTRGIKFNTRTGTFSAVWVSEQGTRAETTGFKLGQKEIPVHEFYALVDISTQNLDDSGYDLEGIIREEASEQLAVAEETAFLLGNGVGKPMGILGVLADVTNSGCTGATNTTVANDYITAYYAVKDAYARAASWLIKRSQIAIIRKYKDATSGQYIWQPGLSTVAPPTIMGSPYLECPGLDIEVSGSSGKHVALFGDFRRAYVIADRQQIIAVRDDLTQRTSGNIRFMYYKRTGGNLVLPEAIVRMTT